MNISNVVNCCGCSSCEYVCHSKAIKLDYSKEGFLYPSVNNTLCNDCGLCLKKCPEQNSIALTDYTEKTYIAYSTNEEILKKSSSGGVFFSLAEPILKNGGCVFGAEFDESFGIRTVCCESKEGITSLMGSKYAQSDMRGVFGIISEKLSKEKIVLFTGTPCQCKAVRLYFGYRDNLIICSVICHGISSTKLLKKYIYEKENEYHSKAEHVNFRDKSAEGWQNFHFSISFKNGEKYTALNTDDSYFFSYLKNAIFRKSCYNCSAKNNTGADLIIGDYWRSDKSSSKINNNKGVSCVIVKSEKGLELLNSTKNLIINEIDKSLIVEGNYCLVNSEKQHSKRDVIYEKIDKYSVDKLCRKYVRNPIKDAVKKFILKIVPSSLIVLVLKKIKNI